jgi:MFS family permease
MAPQLYSIGAILLSTAFLLLGNGLVGTLTPVRAHLEGFSNQAIGAMGSFYYLGFVVGCFVGPRLLARVGHIRTFAVAAALTAATVLLQPIFTQPAMWFADRAAFGVLAAIVYMAIESWLNDCATNETRGRILSAYVIVNLGGLTLGQWLLLAAPPMGYQLFSLAAVLYIFCVVPMGLTHLPQPAPQPRPVLRVLRLARLAPVGIAGVITVGLANAAVWTLGPVYAQSLGFSTFGVALFMSAFIVGGALIQFPLGRFSDRLDRRWIIVCVCAAASLGGVALALLGRVSAEHPYLLYPLAFFFGAAMLPLYSLSIAHANDRLARSEFIEASATLLLVNALASVVGPSLAAFIIAHSAMASLFFYTAAVHLLMTIFTIARITMVRAVPGEVHDHLVALPQTASPNAFELDPRGPEHVAAQPAVDTPRAA